MLTADGTPSPAENRLTRIIKVYERIVVGFLVVLLMGVTALATVELGWLLVRDLSSMRKLLLDVEEMLELFGFFLLVLIGVELITALKGYVRSGMIHVEVVLEVALTALAQKVIVMDTSRAAGLSLLGMAAVILALAAAYWSVRAARQRGGGSG